MAERRLYPLAPLVSIGLCIISDGRFDYLAECINSLEARVAYPFVRKVIVDDSGELNIQLRVRQAFPDYEVLAHPRRQGVSAAIRTAWAAMLETDAEYVFHVEQDFTFNETIDLDDLADILKRRSWLANVTLKRQPYSPVEQAAGDFMRVNPDYYTDRDGYVEWSKLFCCNPSLIRRDVLELAPFSNEGDFARTCKHAGFTFAFYGQKADPPRVTHIGEYRALGWKA